MARILAISSQVARGYVGLSAAVPVLQRLGHEVWPLPTVLLSNHPGHPHVAGQRIGPAEIGAMVEALAAGDWLGEIDAVLTGYLPSAEHVHVAGQTVRRLRQRSPVLYLCDPVLGDDPKGIYIDPHAATAIRNELLPLADIVTPNRFELGWLAGHTTAPLRDTIEAALALGPATVAVTSAAIGATTITSLLIDRAETATVEFDVARLLEAPNGTGDLLAALLLGHRLAGAGPAEAMGRALAGVAAVLAASQGRDELALIAALDAVVAAPPVPGRSLPAT
jgi:pyridoxine kinase